MGNPSFGNDGSGGGNGGERGNGDDFDGCVFVEKVVKLIFNLKFLIFNQFSM